MENKSISSAELKEFINSEEFEIIVGKNHEKYTNKWWLAWAEKEKNISLTRKVSWNWSAFFFTALWFGYRKMYREFLIIGCILIIPTMIIMPIDLSISMTVLSAIGDEDAMLASVDSLGGASLFSEIVNYIDFAISIIVMIISGLYSNVWYLRKCLNLADTAHQQFDSSRPNSKMNANGIENTDDITANASDIDDDIDDSLQNEKINFLKNAGGTII